jgi:hypothetical protein
MRKIITKLFNADKAPPLLFLGMIYLIGVTTNSLTDTIKEWTGLHSSLITIIGLAILWGVIIFFDPVSKFINFVIRDHVELLSQIGMVPERHKGLIVFCSFGSNISAEQAIRFHYKGLNNEHNHPVLKHCWMITGGEASKKAAKELVEKLVKEDFPPDIFKYVDKMSGDDADNPEQVYKIIESIYESLSDEKIEEFDVISDYTGGTKSMTAGMILACAPPERKLQFLKPRKYNPDGTADRAIGSDPRYIDIRFKLKQVS